MAKSREIPAQESESESESEGSDEEVSESESEEAEAPAAAKLQKAAASSSGSEESGSESDSEPDSPRARARAKVKPQPSSSAATKKAQPTAAKLQKAAASSSGSESDSEPDSLRARARAKVKPQPSSSAATKKAQPNAAATTGVKRQATPSLTQDAEKKRLKQASANGEGSKLFERVFAPEDEILLLEELLQRYPSGKPQMDDLYDSLKDKFSVSLSKAQVVDKVKRLRLKFFRNKGKSAKGKSAKKKGSTNVEGEHNAMVYQLSEKIWGNEEGPKSVVKKGPTDIATRFVEAMAEDERATGKDETDTGKDEKKKGVSYASNGRPGDEWIFGEGTGLLAEEAKSELEKGWKKIRKEEARLAIEKFEMSLKHAKLVYDSMSS